MVSIIIPIYNSSEFLENFIQSVFNQSLVNLELLLINQGSTDNCGAICDNYANMDSRIKVIHQQDVALRAARNIGLKETTGDYIWFIDSDD